MWIEDLDEVEYQEPDRVFRVVIYYGIGAIPSLSAYIIALDQQSALKIVSRRFLTSEIDDYSIEIQEITPEVLDILYNRVVKSSYKRTGLGLDLSSMPNQALDILCPQCENGDRILEYVGKNRISYLSRGVH